MNSFQTIEYTPDLYEEISDLVRNPFYVKNSVGKDGANIELMKLRSMKEDADMDLEFLASTPRNQYGKPLNDNRVTKIGRIMRKNHIDELPQIMNVLRGELNLVGLRAVSHESFQKMPEDLRQHYLTEGPALIGVSYAFTEGNNLEDKFRNERKYIQEKERNPVITDVKYFFKTAYNILSGKVKSS